jgi:hypothetical protein
VIARREEDAEELDDAKGSGAPGRIRTCDLKIQASTSARSAKVGRKRLFTGI